MPAFKAPHPLTAPYCALSERVKEVTPFGVTAVFTALLGQAQRFDNPISHPWVVDTHPQSAPYFVGVHLRSKHAIGGWGRINLVQGRGVVRTT